MKKNIVYLALSIMGIFIGITYSNGQSVKNILKSAANHLSGLDIEGVWQYEGVAVQFKSDNVLKKATGIVAASTIEKEFNEQLTKIGFQPGVTTFTFNSDSTFTNIINERKMSGTYTYDKETKYITLKYLNHLPLKAKVSGSGEKISLLFEASGFLSMITFLGSNTSISAVNVISTIVKSYDGIMVGIELKKE